MADKKRLALLLALALMGCGSPTEPEPACVYTLEVGTDPIAFLQSVEWWECGGGIEIRWKA